MEHLIIICLIVLILTSIIRKKYVLTPVTIFSGMWLFIIGLASLKRFGMIDYSEKALLLILISMFVDSTTLTTIAMLCETIPLLGLFIGFIVIPLFKNLN